MQTIIGVACNAGPGRCPRPGAGEGPAAEVLEVAPGSAGRIPFRSSGVVFVTRGEARLTCRGLPAAVVRGGQFVFAPQGGHMRYVARGGARAVVVWLGGGPALCGGRRIEGLWEPGARRAAPRAPRALTLNRPLRLFLGALEEAVRDGMACGDYFEAKARELLILLGAYYARGELREFFEPVLSPDTAFSEYVRANHRRFRTAAELAASMNLSAKHFDRVFVRVFGVTPGRWITAQKARGLHRELASGGKPLKQLAGEYGFATPQQLNRFCRRELGATPGEIRNRGKGVNK